MQNEEYNIDDLPLYKNLSDEAREALHSSAKTYRLRTGAILFRQGEITNTFYSVLSGGVRLVENLEEGKQVNLKIYGPGDVFGLLSLAGEFTHRADLVAVGYSEILAFDALRTRELSQQYPEIAWKLIDLLVLHVEHAHTRIRTLAAEKVERRLARSLLHFCQKFGSPGTNGTLQAANITQQDLAEFTGTTVESVNRHLRKWEQLDIITRHRMQIMIVDPVQLYDLANGSSDNGRGYSADAVP
ncbi:MAG: Crp/Fnr family transcriptional regulator [Blastochloris sp.]|nr:Crp/Fnr family transcriptional regulator [Blastochloris sp.]